MTNQPDPHSLKSKISALTDFMKADIWRIRLHELTRTRAFFIQQLRIVLLALRGFKEDGIYLRASALTFYSLLSVVPVAAMAFGISKGFGFEKHLERQLFESFPGNEEIITKIIDFSHSLLANTKGGIIAGIGLVALFWTVVKVLSNIEQSFNDIWGIKVSRSMARKFSDYLSIMLVAPLLVILSTSATVFVTTQLTLITQKLSFLETFGFVIFFLLKLLPYGVIWALFTFVYILVPNTRVRFLSAFMAGIFAGTAYQLFQWAYIASQIGMARYNAIYGSFAALPLFLIWLRLSWLIALFGAEISFAHQNVDTYEFEPDYLNISPAYKRYLALGIAHLLIKRFSEGQPPLMAPDISRILDMPIRLVRQILFELVKSGILSEICTEALKDTAYQPARDIHTLTVASVMEALEKRGINDLPVAGSRDLTALSETLESLREALRQAPANRPLKDI